MGGVKLVINVTTSEIIFCFQLKLRETFYWPFTILVRFPLIKLFSFLLMLFVEHTFDLFTTFTFWKVFLIKEVWLSFLPAFPPPTWEYLKVFSNLPLDSWERKQEGETVSEIFYLIYFSSCESPCIKTVETEEKSFLYKLFYVFFPFLFCYKHHEKTFPLSICGCAWKSSHPNAHTQKQEQILHLHLPQFSLKYFLCGSTVDFPRSFSSFWDRKKVKKASKKTLLSYA